MSQMAVAVVAASVAVTVAVVRVSRGIGIGFSLGVRFSFSLAIVPVPVGGRGGVGGVWHRDSFLHQTVAPVDHCRRVVSLLSRLLSWILILIEVIIDRLDRS